MEKAMIVCSLAALMIVSFSGCSSKSGSKSTKETKRRAGKETKEKVPDTEAQTSAVLSLSEVQTLNVNDKRKKV